MVQNNKVLTVSYGTFSCTLEGFEDSFGTMKAIAEYFRDLAADDRYFGAEPPQPDADMLARIAQREIARQVEARSGAHGIHLRAAAPAPLEPVASAPAAGTAQLAATPQSAAPQSAAPAPTGATGPEVAAPANPVPPAPAAPLAEAASTTESLARQAEHSTGSPVDWSSDESNAADHADQEAVLWGVNTTLTPAEPDPAATGDLLRSAAIPAEDMMAASLRARTSAPDIQPSSDSIAAKLQRIRAVVAKAPAEDDADFTEDEHAEGLELDDHAALDEALSNLSIEAETEVEADSGDDTGSDTGAETLSASLSAADLDAEESAGEDSISAILDRLNLTRSGEAPEADDSEETPEAEQVTAATEAVESEPTEMAQDESVAEAASQKAAEPEQKAAAEAQETSEPVVPRRPVRGRIIRVKRAQADESLIDATAEEAAETTPQPAEEGRVEDSPRKPSVSSAPIESSLSDEEEDDLMAELAAVEADLLAASAGAAESAEDETDDEDTGAEEDEVTPEASRHEDDAEAPHAPVAARAEDESLRSDPASAAVTTGEGDVSRLIAAANHRLSAEEATASRETYNQLRAAVAAAQADSGRDDEARREARARAYRDDLASVVRPHNAMPRAAQEAGSAGRLASGARAAPLQLVAEQRIDAPSDVPTTQDKPVAAQPLRLQGEEPQVRPAMNRPSESPFPARPDKAVDRAVELEADSTAPVRPRRVSSALLDTEETEPATRVEDGAFAAYARDKGAVELNELLEAAASYMCFVEGRESFSRPQLINKVRMLDGQEGFNREDSLRSFGLLLREGKLKKASNGRFSVSSQIGFRPGNRAAG